MSNMSYCRFRNTASDLADCLEHIEDAVGAEEHRSRAALIKTARAIVEAADNGDVPARRKSDSEFLDAMYGDGERS